MKLPVSQVSIGSQKLRGAQPTSIGLARFGGNLPNIFNIEFRINDHHCHFLTLAIERAEAADQGFLFGTDVIPVDPTVNCGFLLGYITDDGDLLLRFGNVAPVVVVEEVNHIFHCG